MPRRAQTLPAVRVAALQIILFAEFITNKLPEHFKLGLVWQESFTRHLLPQCESEMPYCKQKLCIPKIKIIQQVYSWQPFDTTEWQITHAFTLSAHVSHKLYADAQQNA